VVIFADPDNLVQIVSAPPFFQDNDNKLEPVTAVTGSNKTGKVSVAAITLISEYVAYIYFGIDCLFVPQSRCHPETR
jgi:hypothetical protein